MKKKNVKEERVPESLAAWNARLSAYAASSDLPQVPAQPRQKPDNEAKLRAQIEAQHPFLRLEFFIHEQGCASPCACRVRAWVTKFARYGRPERHLVYFRE